MDTVRVVVALGQFGWDAALRAFESLGTAIPIPRPKFGHLAEATIESSAARPRWRLVGSYHPSQQNTFTGRLTAVMFDAVIERAKALAAGRSGSGAQPASQRST